MSTAIIDFDDTLLNTGALKDALAASLNLSTEQWTKAYQQYVADNSQFDTSGFLRGVDKEQRDAFTNVLHRTQQFLYPDSMPFIRRLLADSWRVVILTHGDRHWQKMKLDYCVLPSQVEMRITAGDKTTLVSEYIDEKTIFIDDRAEIVDTIQQLYPHVTIYWMRRSNGAHRTPKPERCDNIIEDLTLNIN